MVDEPGAREHSGPCRSILRGLLEATGTTKSSVSLRLTNDAEIRSLNHRFLGKNRATDVLAFPAEGDLEPGHPHLGDIAVSMPQAARQARAAGWDLKFELALLITHGFLHLMGHDHVTDDGTMLRMERDLLQRVAGVSIDERRRPWGQGRPRVRRRTSRTSAGELE